MAAVATSLVPVALLVIFWAFSFKSSFLPHSSPQELQGRIYSALHPLFMVIGFILISGEVKCFMVVLHQKVLEFSIVISNALMSWLMGFLSFWHRGEVCAVRLRVLPWHVFIALYTYGLAVATAETGLLEKSTFLQTERNVSKHCPESTLVNSLGLGLALVLWRCNFGYSSPKYQALQTKLIYSSDSKKCMSS